ncbi:MAG: ABC transporter ATP-binding protein/permease [Ruminococcaceae bacterium]|nr:ABC transporter ATP-binding protein/permease [Oscillospiraceae bacterium]
MLKLKGITKDYVLGDLTVHALRGVDMNFRKSEFVSILGPSGCGKTTLLNIIGGLDRYTSGDLVINGKSTKEYEDREWDSYRNHKIGFVFQTYNLIPHQTVLSNVELALTLSGVSKAERRRRAKEVLEQVGLGDQLNKKPSQMSGGQQQRVAIARALVNNPDIILADEPTGALDTDTSVQIMEILKKISKDRLIIMVTHNPDLADQYSNRIIRLVDGLVTSDSNPYTEEEYNRDFGGKKEMDQKQGHGRVSMSFKTALSLSLNNLLTKKARTFLTSFAGSIGIIGIALILALSNGIQLYIDTVQRDTLASYPISITSETMDYTELFMSMAENQEKIEDRDENKIYSNTMMARMLSAMVSEIKKNNLQEFKKYIDSGVMEEYISAVQYAYAAKMQIYSYGANKVISSAPGESQLVYPSTIINEAMSAMGGGVSEEMIAMGGGGFESWSEILEGRNGEIINPLIKDQYELVGENSRFPENYNEIVIVVSKDNQISDMALFALGIKDMDYVKEFMENLMTGNSEGIDTEVMDFTFDQLLGLKFKLVLPTELYEQNSDGIWVEKKNVDAVVEDGVDLKVVGIIRPKESTASAAISGEIGYTAALTKYAIEQCAKSEIMKYQEEHDTVDIFTGESFSTKVYNKENVNELVDALPEETLQMMMGYINQQMAQYGLPEITTKEELATMLGQMQTDDQIAELAEELLGISDSTLYKNLVKLGYCDIEQPSSINIYASSFEAKEMISDIISQYNKDAEESGKEENVIRYTDIMALMMSSFSDIVNFISYGLMAFVSVSLVVSSIMIGIITYISVLERTKEIGILRAIGASKKDIKSVFNAETMIVGFSSGVIGIAITLILTVPVNFIMYALTDISNIATLPVAGAFILIAISTVLTLIAGLFPAVIAARRDPVTSLRSE